MRILLPLLLFSVAACTQTAADVERQAAADAGTRAELDRELAGLVPGRTQGCATQTELRNLKTFGDTLVYDTNGSDKLVTRTSGGCERVGAEGILVTRTPSTQLCRGDIATVVDRNSRFTIGSCSFGDFTRYERPREG